MNKTFRYLISCCLVFVSTNLLAQSASTTPVGYVTLTVNGSPNGTSPGYTALSVSLEKPVVSVGSATSGSTSAALVDSNASNTVNAYAATDAVDNGIYYLQITSGDNEGLIFDIVSNTATSITTATDLTGIVFSGDTYAVKQNVTLADIFGAENDVGLASGGSPNSSDLVFIMSSDGSGNYAIYYYQTDNLGFLGGNGWRAYGDTNTDMSGVTIASDDGILIQRSVIGDLSIFISGRVNTVNHSRDLPAGFSLVSYPFPVDVTLADSGIYTASNGYVSGGSFLESDSVYVLNPDGTFQIYYYQTDNLGFLGGNGWRIAGDANTAQENVVISAESSVIILHRGSGLAWADEVPFSI
jgi:uncharacterized protein (TIGR02597 family)